MDAKLLIERLRLLATNSAIDKPCLRLPTYPHQYARQDACNKDTVEIYPGDLNQALDEIERALESVESTNFGT